MLEFITPAPPDPILGLTEAFVNDPNENKINLGVGVYQDDDGKTPLLATVREAEALILETAKSKSYLPISGSPEYARAVQGLLFGEGHDGVTSGRAQTLHCPGGTGALRVGGDFLRGFLPDSTIWVSAPTWANHKGIFSAAGFELKEYPYYDAATKSLDFEALVSALQEIPAGDIVLFHVCCHNPTGVDPTAVQWAEVARVVRDRGIFPFLDFAYQGLGQSLEHDRSAVLAFIAEPGELMVASSFSKNFSLYQDRVGALTFVGADAAAAKAALSHLKRTVRVNYSNPPAHGGLIVQTILGDAKRTTRWRVELDQMRDRIKQMRSALVAGLKARGVEQDFSFIARQNGMFSFSGLTDAQVAWLREERSIYIVKGGRINVAGITTSNIDYLCDAVVEALAK